MIPFPDFADLKSICYGFLEHHIAYWISKKYGKTYWILLVRVSISLPNAARNILSEETLVTACGDSRWAVVCEAGIRRSFYCGEKKRHIGH